MATHTRKKFVRGNAPSGRLRLAPTDSALLSDLALYRFLNTEQIAALHHRGLRNLQRRLSDLFHEGYVERPLQQKTSPLLTGHMVYSLGKQGVGFLFEDATERRDKLRQVKLNERIAFPHIAHDLMISQFHAELVLALKKFQAKAELTRWVQGYDLKDLLSPQGGRAELVPDAFFSVDTPKGRLNFFLEADRKTEHPKIFLYKMKTYWKWYQEKRCEKNLGITRFRVLTIAPDERRTEDLRRIAKRAYPNKESRPMFLFACEKSFSLGKPEAVLSPVWLPPMDDVKRALIE